MMQMLAAIGERGQCTIGAQINNINGATTYVECKCTIDETVKHLSQPKICKLNINKIETAGRQNTQTFIEPIAQTKQNTLIRELAILLRFPLNQTKTYYIVANKTATFCSNSFGKKITTKPMIIMMIIMIIYTLKAHSASDQIFMQSSSACDIYHGERGKASETERKDSRNEQNTGFHNAKFALTIRQRMRHTGSAKQQKWKGDRCRISLQRSHAICSCKKNHITDHHYHYSVITATANYSIIIDINKARSD